jgi:glutamate 5-kinase
MASSISVELLKAENKVTLYDHNPGDTAAADVAWVDMRDFESFLAGYLRTSGTGGLTYKILANAQSDGTGTDVIIKTGTAVPDAVDDYCFLECNSQEVREVGDAAGVAGQVRYVSLNLTNATALDRGSVVYILGRGKGVSGNTADSVA